MFVMSISNLLLKYHSAIKIKFKDVGDGVKDPGVTLEIKLLFIRR